MEPPKGHLSFSQVSTYLQCPKKYYLAYCEQIKSPPAIAMKEGSTWHQTLEFYNSEHILHKNYPMLSNTMEVFAEKLNENTKDIEDWEGETRQSILSRASAILPDYVNKIAVHIEPSEVEREVIFLVDNIKVLGFIDLLCSMEDFPKVLVDYKTVKRKKTARDVQSSLQLQFYQHTLNGEYYPSFCSLEKSTRRCHMVVGEINYQKEKVIQPIRSAIQGIKKEYFGHCNPEEWFCNPKWCGYYPLCYGVKR